MNRGDSTRALALPLLLMAGACLAQAPAPAEFAWRAQLDLPAGTSVARVALPPQALLQLQSGDARDVRVFNAGGEAVAFAFTRPAAGAPVAQRTRDYLAHPLFSPGRGARPARGSVQVRIAGDQAAPSVWVQIDGSGNVSAPPPQATRLASALFTTQDEKQAIRALAIRAELPANAPVRISAATSADLAQWTPVSLRGRLFRFEGAQGFTNDTLELESPLRLEGRYLRLDWDGQEGVNVSAVTGIVANAAEPVRVRADLPPATPGDKAALEWQLGFATPVMALALSTPQPNTLVPVRILGRSDAAQPWRQLAQTVVYRLGANGGETTNPPVALNGVSTRWLRVEATHGMALGREPLQAAVEFDPVQLVFLASGSGPFELAVGRAATPAASIGSSLLAAAVPGKIDAVPQARIGAVTVGAGHASRTDMGPLAWLLPAGTTSRTLWLWGVLLGGVLLLGGVAWSLLRQLKGKP